MISLCFGIAIFIIIALISLSCSALAYVSPLDNTEGKILYTDISNNFSIVYSEKIIQDNLKAPWHLTVWIEPSQVLQQIKNVSYQFYPALINGIVTTTNLSSNSSEKKFSQSLDISAGLQINIKIYLKNGKHISFPALSVPTTCDVQSTDCPNAFIINPKIYGLNVIINGNVTRKTGELTNITVNWGDGNKDTSLHFPFIHTYSKAAPYIITVESQIRIGLIIIKSFMNITTNDLNVENSIPVQSSVKISPKSNSILNVSTNTINSEDSIPFSYKVEGNLVNMSGYGISNIPIFITLLLKGHPEKTPYVDNKLTDKDGHYSFVHDNLVLHEGDYQVLVQPKGPLYFGFNVTRDLLVSGHILSKEELITILTTFIATGIGIFGAIVTIPGFLKRRKQSRHLSTQLLDINTKFNEFCKTRHQNKKEYLTFFEALSSHIIYLLENGSINEDQYKLLDDKIKDYINKITDSK